MIPCEGDTMFDRSAIEKIEEMSAPVGYQIDSLQYSSKPLKLIEPPEPMPVETSTLESIVTYFFDLPNEHEYLIHVVSPEQVRIISVLNSYQQRKVELIAHCIYKPFQFGRDVEVAKFIIALQAQFVQDETTANILRLVGNLKSSAEHTTLDDGVTQTVTAKAGITRVENVAVPNPVTLRPFRTFIEIEQPASKFVFRLNAAADRTPTCALYEADGGAWQIQAIANIKAYLEEKLPEATIMA
jgi:hypothetical protein